MMLARQGFTRESVPPGGRIVRLKSTANLSSGGTSIDVTDEVHPAVRDMAERISRAIGLDVCGIDVVAPHLRSGLAFDACDVGVLTNIASDHLGSDGIDTIEDLARVKATVIAAVRPGGVAVLNADDARTLEAAPRAQAT